MPPPRASPRFPQIERTTAHFTFKNEPRRSPPRQTARRSIASPRASVFPSASRPRVHPIYIAFPLSSRFLFIHGTWLTCRPKAIFPSRRTLSTIPNSVRVPPTSDRFGTCSLNSRNSFLMLERSAGINRQVTKGDPMLFFKRSFFHLIIVRNRSNPPARNVA